MPRLNPIDSARATDAVKGMLDAVKAKLGLVPNMMRTMAVSPAVLEGYLGLSGALAKGVLPASVRESIALAVAERNACDYCLSAHSVLGRLAGLRDEEIARNRRLEAADPKTGAALKLAGALLATRGAVDDDAIVAARRGGLGDGEIAEVVAHVAVNVFTNYFNKTAETAIDFPKVEAGRLSA